MNLSQSLKTSSAITSIAAIVIGFTALTFLMGPQHFNGLEYERIGERLINRLYFVMTTVSTVGYGDISPKTPFARLVGITIMSLMLVSVI